MWTTDEHVNDLDNGGRRDWTERKILTKKGGDSVAVGISKGDLREREKDRTTVMLSMVNLGNLTGGRPKRISENK